MDKIIVKNSLEFKKSILKELKNCCDIEIKEDEYIITNIQNEEFIVYTIASQIVEYLYNTYFKTELSKHLSKEIVKKVMHNHDMKTYEKFYLAFLLKIKLGLYFKYNDTLNINSFLKFNAKRIYEELDNFIELEVSSDGEFLEEDETPNEFESEEYNEMVLVSKIIEVQEIKETMESLHIYKDNKGVFHIQDDNKKKITSKADNLINNMIERLYGENKKDGTVENVLSRFGVYIGAFNPERVIIYDSLDDEEKDKFIKYFSFAKIICKVDTECFISKENIPS